MPQKITAASPTSSRLLTRNTDSREASDSIRRSERRSSRRETISAAEPRITNAIRNRSGRPDGRLAERVDRLEDPGADEERAEQGERERRDDQRDVPDLEHPAFLLDHHRVQERGADQPRHQRGVLDRIPSPVAAPAELRVRPAGAEQDPDREEDPGDEREPPRRADPARVEAAAGERPDRERERDRPEDVARVEHRRVDRHRRVAEQRRQPGALERRRDRGGRTGSRRTASGRLKKSAMPPSTAVA